MYKAHAPVIMEPMQQMIADTITVTAITTVITVVVIVIVVGIFDICESEAELFIGHQQMECRLSGLHCTTPHAVLCAGFTSQGTTSDLSTCMPSKDTDFTVSPIVIS